MRVPLPIRVFLVLAGVATATFVCLGWFGMSGQATVWTLEVNGSTAVSEAARVEMQIAHLRRNALAVVQSRQIDAGFWRTHPEVQRVALGERVVFAPSVPDPRSYDDSGMWVLEIGEGRFDVLKSSLSGGAGRVVDARPLTKGSYELQEDGRAHLAGYAPVVNAPLGVLVTTAVEDVRPRARTGRLLIAGGAILLGVVLLTFLVLRPTRPIRDLLAATKSIARGDFDIRVPIHGRSEFDELSRSFNVMANEVQFRQAQLDGAQRTLVQSEKMSAFGQMGAGITHEIRNPLAGISSLAQFGADRAGEDEDTRNLFRQIEDASKRCLDVLQNLLTFTRRTDDQRTRVDLHTVVADTLKLVSHQLHVNNVRVETDLSAESSEILGDSGELQQVVLNLILNAQQALADQEARTIHVSSSEGRRAGRNAVELRVKDNGPGMAPDVAERVFDPFFTTKQDGEGTGLGLAVSFGIISQHGGVILVESTPGEGTTFVVSIPKYSEAVAESASAS